MFTLITHVAPPANQTAPITSADLFVTSSRDFTSQAAFLLTVISIKTFRTLYQSQKDFNKLTAF